MWHDGSLEVGSDIGGRMANMADLISKGKEMQNTLREKLRQDFDDMSRRAQLERKKSENESLNDTLNNIPLAIFIG